MHWYMVKWTFCLSYLQSKYCLKSNNLNVEIEIDGGVNFETGQKCVEAGAHVLVAGSFLFNQGDLINATNSLLEKFN